MDSTWLWIVFGVVIVGMLVLDLLVFRRQPVAMPFRTAAAWSGVWIGLALLFGTLIWLEQGSEKGLEFAAGYVIEWSLSVDNLFVFLLIFSYFAVPPVYQHRVLFWGIMGAVLMRAGFIAAGVALLAWFHWMFYVFGGFLVITGIRMALSQEQDIEPERNPVLRLFRRLMPVTPGYRGERFFVKEGARWIATPLVPVLLLIETTDLIFAVDSVPAILAITTDPFIVYTSNVFAILGLRSLFFVLAGVMGLFRYLRVGLAVVLVFVGVKMLVADILHIPVGISLGVIACVLFLSVLLSLAIRRPVSAPGAVGSPGIAVSAASRAREDRAA
jgi:tellurite resistance protein TerC